MGLSITRDVPSAKLKISYRSTLHILILLFVAAIPFLFSLPVFVFLGPLGGVAFCMLAFIPIFLFFIVIYFVFPGLTIIADGNLSKTTIILQGLLGRKKLEINNDDVEAIYIKEFWRKKIKVEQPRGEGTVYFYLLFLLRDGSIAYVQLKGVRSFNFPIKDGEVEKIAKALAEFLNVPFEYVEFSKKALPKKVKDFLPENIEMGLIKV